MSEKLRNTPENAIDTEWHKASNERSVEIANSLEKAVEKLPTNIENKDEITHEALEIAASHENRQLETHKTKEPKEKRPLTKKDIDNSYKKTLTNMQGQLSAPSRAFSRVIHNPVVEKTSDAIGNTVARPNLIISGALGAIASVFVYFIAKRYGYLLSGSETIVLFVAGWAIGAVIEYARVGLLNNRKSR
ncbi:MAG: hypothetical protein D8G53_11955 [Candidatus Saccharimonas sp.]|nr:MAG: hypothetical protein D8G53_11955 [Candidatus Saccharimonas sp.]